MAVYSKKISVLARVVVTLPDVGLEYVVNWEDAAKAKDKAAKWLLGQSADSSVHVDIQQRSDDVPFVDHGTFVGQNDKEFAVEYGAAFLKNFKTWGRGR